MRRVLVTGAASGIGLATALLLRERGVEVIAADRSAEGLAVTRSLAHAFGPRGVRVNAVLPGLIATPMQDGVLDRVSAIRGVPRAELEASRLAPVVLERRDGTARECAESIAFLLSSASSYVTGQGLSVDGGIAMP